MNRLWVRISLVIAFVAIFIALFPWATRRLTAPEWPGGQFTSAFTEELPPGTFAGVPPERLDRFQENFGNRVWENLSRTVAFGAIIGLVVGVLLSRSMVKPLTELEKGAKEIAAHNLAYRVPEKGSQEVRTVARSFNEMAVELEQEETLRRNMLADVTHELRHPVHVLRGNLRGIIDGVFPLQMEEIVFLEEETRHLSQLVNDLHELALAEAHELPLQKQEVELGSLVQDATDAVHPLALDKNIALQAAVPDSPIRATVDPARLRQVIHNLLSNAIHYSPEGGRVTVSLAEGGDGILLEVVDNGVGLTAEELPHVFDRFYQTDSSRDRALGGAGLGLAISKAIVEAHDGRITAASPGRDQGSTFTIHLPSVNHPA